MGPTMAAADEILEALLYPTPAVRADPYPLYHELRSIAPLYQSDLDGLWYASRFADCLRLLSSPQCGRKPARPVRAYGMSDEEFEHFCREPGRPSMMTEDPPEHGRLRGLVSAFFGPRQLEALQPRIEVLVDELLDAVAAKGAVDALAELAVPLPLTVISDIVGVPPEDRQYLWDMAHTVVYGDCADPPPDMLEAGAAAVEARVAYFSELIARRRVDPEDDVLSAMILESDREQRLSDDELVDMANLLVLAGFIPATDLIANGLLALLRHPEELARLRAHPAAGVAPAVEEMLRYDGPIQYNGRTVLEPLEVGGTTLPAGAMVTILTGAANRDPAAFVDPDRFVANRPGNHPLSFGSGVHHCLGAGLARLETRILFRRLVERFETLELIETEPPRHPSSGDRRGLAALPIRAIPASRTCNRTRKGAAHAALSHPGDLSPR